MWWTCGGHVVVMWWTCDGHVVDMWWTCDGHVMDMWQTQLKLKGRYKRGECVKWVTPRPYSFELPAQTNCMSMDPCRQLTASFPSSSEPDPLSPPSSLHVRSGSKAKVVLDASVVLITLASFPHTGTWNKAIITRNKLSELHTFLICDNMNKNNSVAWIIPHRAPESIKI